MTLIQWQKVLGKKSVWFSSIIIIAFILVAILAPWLAPHDPYLMGMDTYLPPAWVRNITPPGDADYPLGTDRFGRDIYSRLLYGTRTAAAFVLVAIPLSVVAGTTAGLVAGYAGGWVDRVITFFTDIIQALPGIMFVVIIILIFRNSLVPTWIGGVMTLVTGFVLVSWAGLARLVRVNVMQMKAQPFIEASIALGASRSRVAFSHLLPNVMHLILVWVINNIPAIILLEAVLGYIGIGLTSAIDGDEFNVVSWGGLFYAGRSALGRNPFILFIPAVCVLLVSISFFLLADALTEATRRKQ